MPNLIFLAGSARKHSFNKRLAQTACKLAEEKGANVEYIDLADYNMPIYCEDYEAENGLPASVIALKEKFQNCDGFFMASPEYNSAISPLLKNTIDWLSRPHGENEPMLSAYKGKVASLAAASPGGLGGLRGLHDLKSILSNIGVFVCPTMVAVGGANDAFNEIGLIDDQKLKMLDGSITEFVNTATKLSSS
jgi:NAD(P)H-dependent FMN reductase